MLRSVHKKPAAEWQRGVGLAFGALNVPMGQVRGSLSVLHPEVDLLLKSQSKQQEMHSFNAFWCSYLPPSLSSPVAQSRESLSSEIQALLERNGSRQPKPHNWDSDSPLLFFTSSVGKVAAFSFHCGRGHYSCHQSPIPCSVALRREGCLGKFLPLLWISTHL